MEFFGSNVSFVPSATVHGFDVEDGTDAFVISISDDLLRTLEPGVDLDLTKPCLIGGTASDPLWMRLKALIGMVADEYRESARASPRLISGLIGVVLSQIGNLGGHQAMEDMSPSRALAAALRRAIDRHYREDWPVSRYVDVLATTPHLLDKAARETFGQSVKDMLMERRLLEAKRLLRFTIRSIEDIGGKSASKTRPISPAFFASALVTPRRVGGKGYLIAGHEARHSAVRPHAPCQE